MHIPREFGFSLIIILIVDFEVGISPLFLCFLNHPTAISNP